MSRVYSDTVLPEDSGVSQDLTLGTTGDTVQVTSGASLNVNTIKDAGGNTIFVSDGSGTLSSVNSGMVGMPGLITTNTVTGEASSAFTTGIDSSYKLYIFKFYQINPVTDNTQLTVNFSTDGGSNYNMTKTTTFFRAYHYENDSDAAIGYVAGDDLAQSTDYQKLVEKVGNGADESCAGELYLFNPSSTTYVKQFYSRVNSYGSGADVSIDNFVGGYINSTDNVDAIDFKMSSGNFDGIIKMYGM